MYYGIPNLCDDAGLSYPVKLDVITKTKPSNSDIDMSLSEKAFECILKAFSVF